MKTVLLLLAVMLGALGLGCSSIESNPSCEVLGESCKLDIQSCYANHSTGEETCANTGNATEGQPCDTVEDADGSVIPLTNGCADSLGCNLQLPDVGLTCAQYCDTTASSSSCTTGFRCCEIRSFYNCGGKNAREGLGFCVNPVDFPSKFDGISGCPIEEPPPEGCPNNN